MSDLYLLLEEPINVSVNRIDSITLFHLNVYTNIMDNLTIYSKLVS